MTRKHFKATAETIKAANDKREIAEGLAAIFAKENPRFDRARFMEACGF